MTASYLTFLFSQADDFKEAVNRSIRYLVMFDIVACDPINSRKGIMCLFVCDGARSKV